MPPEAPWNVQIFYTARHTPRFPVHNLDTPSAIPVSASQYYPYKFQLLMTNFGRFFPAWHAGCSIERAERPDGREAATPGTAGRARRDPSTRTKGDGS